MRRCCCGCGTVIAPVSTKGVCYPCTSILIGLLELALRTIFWSNYSVASKSRRPPGLGSAWAREESLQNSNPLHRSHLYWRGTAAFLPPRHLDHRVKIKCLPTMWAKSWRRSAMPFPSGSGTSRYTAIRSPCTVGNLLQFARFSIFSWFLYVFAYRLHRLEYYVT